MGQNAAPFGGAELAAFELGISAVDALALQRIAAEQLGFAVPVPEPATWALGLGPWALGPGPWVLGLAGLAVVGAAVRRRRLA